MMREPRVQAPTRLLPVFNHYVPNIIESGLERIILKMGLLIMSVKFLICDHENIRDRKDQSCYRLSKVTFCWVFRQTDPYYLKDANS